MSHRLLPTIDQAGYLPPSPFQPGESIVTQQRLTGVWRQSEIAYQAESWSLAAGSYVLRCFYLGQLIERSVYVGPQGEIVTRGAGVLSGPQAVFLAELCQGEQSQTVMLAERQTQRLDSGAFEQNYQIYRTRLKSQRQHFSSEPTLKWSRWQADFGQRKGLFPWQLAPSVQDIVKRRVGLSFDDAIVRLADLIQAYQGRLRLYLNADQAVLNEWAELLGTQAVYPLLEPAQSDYIWPVQNEAKSPYEAKSLSAQSSWILNGWDGLISDLPFFEQLLEQVPSVWLLETRITPSARVVAERYGRERILLLRPGGETLFAMALAHQLLEHHASCLADLSPPDAQDFVAYVSQARFSPEQIAKEIAPEPTWEERLNQGIISLAQELATSKQVLHLPGIGLWRSGGWTAVATWRNLWTLLGKGEDWQQISAPGLSPADSLRAGEGECVVAIGTALEASFFSDRERWLAYCTQPQNRLVMIDGQPGPWSLAHASLCLPLAPQCAQKQAEQAPRRQAAPETRALNEMAEALRQELLNRAVTLSPQSLLQIPQSRFFIPHGDLSLSEGVVLTWGLTPPGATMAEVQHAIARSGPGASLVAENEPQERVLYLSPSLASHLSLSEGDTVELTQAGALPWKAKLNISPDLVGNQVYLQAYFTRTEREDQSLSLPWMRYQSPICPYSGTPLLNRTLINVQHAQEAL